MILRVAGACVLSLAIGGCGDDGGGGGGGGDGSALRGEGEPCTDDAQCADGFTCDLAHAEPTCEVPHDDSTPQSSSAGGDGGAGGAGGAGGSGGGAPASDCELLCTCLAATCSAFDGYPYEGEAECLDACAARTDAEVRCWGGFCEQAAEAVAGKDHLCEHAWGDAGLDEC